MLEQGRERKKEKKAKPLQYDKETDSHARGTIDSVTHHHYTNYINCHGRSPSQSESERYASFTDRVPM